MFDFVRRHTKLFMVVLFVLVFPAFALWGIGSYSRMGSSAKAAVVDGQPITQAEWEQAHRIQSEQMRQGVPGINLALLDTPAMRYATLEALVRERVLATAAYKQHIAVSDAALADALQSDPVIASLRKADGTLDMEAYTRLAAQRGLTPQGFEAGVRAQLARQQVLGGVVDSSFAPAAVVSAAMDPFAAQRQVRLLRVKPDAFKEQAEKDASDKALQDYYQQHQSQYQAPETADVQYVVLGTDELKKDLTPSDEELRSYYEQNAATLGTPEERRAAHILIEAPKDAPAAEREGARKKAQELLEEVKNAPDTFADVARRASQDSTSAPEGGELGRFTHGKSSGLDAALEAAIFALDKEGAISAEPVESEYGWHIVRLTALKPATTPTFEEAKARIEDAWRTQEAQRRYSEAAEEFRNIAYEQPGTLAPIADRFGLKVQTASGIARAPAPKANGALASAPFLAALFSPDAIEKKHNTEAMEIASQRIASGRISTYNPARTRPFDEVKAEVKSAFTAQRAAELARADGERQLKALQDGGNAEALEQDAITISRQDAKGLNASAIEVILRAATDKLPTYVGASAGADGYLIARIDKVLPREASATQTESDRRTYEQAWAMSEAQSYYETLKKQYGAEILAPRPGAETQ